MTRVDLLLLCYLLLGVLSSAMATNRWLALRARAITALGLVLFWVARSLRQAGLAPPLLGSLAVAIVLVACNAMQLAAMEIYETHGDRASLARAANIDPGNYRIQLQLARGGSQRCEHARAAHALFPSAQAAAEAGRGCR